MRTASTWPPSRPGSTASPRAWAALFVTAAGDGSCLAVLSDADSDVGLVAYEMTLLVKRVGAHLGSAPRTDLPSGG